MLYQSGSLKFMPLKPRPTSDLMRYAGWGTQLFVMLALAVYGGNKADKWLDFSFPLLTIFLPFLVLIVMIVKLIKDTSNNSKNNEPSKY
jgi:hypothetical protein